MGLVSSEPVATELLLTIRNEKPLPAALMSDLLSALSKDYRRLNRGRTLVVSRIQMGSWWIYLCDMIQTTQPYLKNGVEFAKGGKAILDFAKGIREAVGKAKGPEVHVNGGMHGVARTVEALAKVAIEAGSEIQVSQKSSDGTLIDVRITPPEALLIREIARQRALAEKPSPSLLQTNNILRVSRGIDAKALADQLQHLAVEGPATSVHPVLSAVLAVLRQDGNSHFIDALAYELEGRGYYDLAEIVRDVNRKGGTAQVSTSS